MCFSTIATLIADAALSGVNLAVRPASSVEGQLDVIVTFMQKPVGNDTALWSAPSNSSIDQALALRSAMNTPVVVRCAPADLATAITTALEQLKQPLTNAAEAYGALDVAQLLSSASKTKKSKPAPDTPAAPQVDGDGDDDESEQKPEQQAAIAADVDYLSIDSL